MKEGKFLAVHGEKLIVSRLPDIAVKREFKSGNKKLTAFGWLGKTASDLNVVVIDRKGIVTWKYLVKPGIFAGCDLKSFVPKNDVNLTN